MGPENFRLIESLQTAVSAKREDWLEQNEKLIAERHAAGKLSDEQHAALEAIVAKARAGQWDEAGSDALALAKAQRPAAEK